tara:strand:+ start:891 stop:1067 length:177 start_codon:yes stop_codon:yes gene_type:complete
LNFKIKNTADVPIGLAKGSNASRDVPKRAKKLILNRIQKNDITFKSSKADDSSIIDPG